MTLNNQHREDDYSAGKVSEVTENHSNANVPGKRSPHQTFAFKKLRRKGRIRKWLSTYPID